MISAYFFVCLLVVAPLMLFVSGAEILTSSGTRAEVKGIASPEHFSASMRGSAVHVPAFVASKGSSGDVKRDPESVKEAVSTTYTLVGSYSLESGPAWSSVPPAYSCQAACAAVFGGVASDYAGSISDVSITNTCYYDKYAGSTSTSTLLSASFSSCATYVSGCYSAYVQDHTTIQPTKNFCYSSKVVAVPTAKPTVKPTLKPTTAPSNVLTPNAYRGTFLVNNGPSWGSYPPTYTCQQACALLFGGSPSDFQGSTSSSSITNTCYAQQYAGSQYPYLIPDTYSNCTTYSTAGCISTYVHDASITVSNYCFNHK